MTKLYAHKLLFKLIIIKRKLVSSNFKWFHTKQIVLNTKNYQSSWEADRNNCFEIVCITLMNFIFKNPFWQYNFKLILRNLISTNLITESNILSIWNSYKNERKIEQASLHIPYIPYTITGNWQCYALNLIIKWEGTCRHKYTK